MRASRRSAAAVAAAVTLVLLVAGCGSHRYVPAATPATPTPDSVQAQLDYVHAHWKDRNVDEFGSLGGTDCVNFTSQSLLARGWAMTDAWGHSLVDGQHGYTSAWISSTAMRDWLAGHPELATAVADDDRSQLALGDIVQFDWDNSGDRDHTGVITRMTGDGDSRTIEIAAHTDPGTGYEYRDVDRLLRSHGPSARVYYWHLAVAG